MPKNLVIVESPAKAKTIERFLGKEFQVESSFGHIADLPSKELGVDVENDFKPKYTVDKEKKALVKKLKDLAKKAETIWLASDEDREGEAISWHLAEELGLDRTRPSGLFSTPLPNRPYKRRLKTLGTSTTIWSMRSRPEGCWIVWWGMNFPQKNKKK